MRALLTPLDECLDPASSFLLLFFFLKKNWELYCQDRSITLTKKGVRSTLKFTKPCMFSLNRLIYNLNKRSLLLVFRKKKNVLFLHWFLQGPFNHLDQCRGRAIRHLDPCKVVMSDLHCGRVVSNTTSHQLQHYKLLGMHVPLPPHLFTCP